MSQDGDENECNSGRSNRAEARLVRNILVTQHSGILPESPSVGRQRDRAVQSSPSIHSSDSSMNDSKQPPHRVWPTFFATSPGRRYFGYGHSSSDDNSGVQNHMKGLYNDKSMQNSPVHSDGKILKETAGKGLVLYPNQRFKTAWDLYILILLMYIALVSVYVYSFLGVLRPDSVWFWIERFLDVSFVTDIVLFFFTAYEKSDGTFEVDRRKIRYRYLRTWFTVDLIGTVPWGIIALGVNRDSTEGPSVLLLPRYMRLLRLTKLFRVARLLRISRKFTELEVRLRIKYGYLRLASLLVTVVLVAHWFACLFYYFGFITNGTCTSGEDCQYPTWFLKEAGDIPLDNFGRYIASLYFSVYTITTIGYGDVVPETTAERSYTIIIMLFGAAMFAYVISQVSNIQNELKESTVYHRKQMDRLTDLAKYRNLPLELQREIRRDFEHEYRRQRVLDEKNLFENIRSDELRFRVLEHIYGEHVRKSGLLKFISSIQLSQLYQDMEEKEAQMGEILYKKGDSPNNFYVVKSGAVAVRTGKQEQVFKEREYFGDEGLFFGRPRERIAMCIEDTKLIVVPRQAVMKTLSNNEKALKRVKTEQAMELWSRAIWLMEGEMRFAKMARLLRDRGEEHMRGKGVEISRRDRRGHGVDGMMIHSASETLAGPATRGDKKLHVSVARLPLLNEMGGTGRDQDVVDRGLSDHSSIIAEVREAVGEEELKRQLVEKCNEVRELQGRLNELQSRLSMVHGQFGDILNVLKEVPP